MSTDMNRRSFLLGLLATPAVVRAGSLEYVPRGRVLVPAETFGTRYQHFGRQFQPWDAQLMIEEAAASRFWRRYVPVWPLGRSSMSSSNSNGESVSSMSRSPRRNTTRPLS